jgi:hypothetical protein
MVYTIAKDSTAISAPSPSVGLWVRGSRWPPPAEGFGYNSLVPSTAVCRWMGLAFAFKPGELQPASAQQVEGTRLARCGGGRCPACRCRRTGLHCSSVMHEPVVSCTEPCVTWCHEVRGSRAVLLSMDGPREIERHPVAAGCRSLSGNILGYAPGTAGGSPLLTARREGGRCRPDAPRTAPCSATSGSTRAGAAERAVPRHSVCPPTWVTLGRRTGRGDG